MSNLRCAFIGSGQQLVACAEQWLARGHEVVGFVSDCPEVGAFAQRRGIARLDSREDQATWLAREPFGYLFSVVNHAITAPEVLAIPQRMAINFHDSPLPRYAGFNATAWAIMDGRSFHAVTWHEMTASVDGGRILLQQRIEIREDDTAFSLGVRCAEACVTSFGVLVESIENAERQGVTLTGTPQGANEDFHFRSARPDLAILDFERRARELHARVRGLNFGPEDSWMCKPKLATQAGLLAVTEARVVGNDTGAAPGTVLSVDRGGVEVAAHEGSILLSDITTLEGAVVDVAALREHYGVREGVLLRGLSADLDERARELDARLTKHERFWVQRLATVHAPLLPELKAQSGALQTAVLVRPMPTALVGASEEVRRIALASAFAAYLARVGEGGAFDLAVHAPLVDEFAWAFAVVTPFRCTVDLEASFATLRAQTQAEFVVQAARGSYARDALLRYRALRPPAARAALGIGMRFDYRAPDDAVALLPGTHLTLASGSNGQHYVWAYDERAISRDAVGALASRCEVLLEAALADPTKPLAMLPLLPEAERALLLDAWQDTRAAYAADKCVHELFEEQVARTPDATAVVFRGVTLCYRELNERANAVAHSLIEAGVLRDTLVGICVERSLDMMVGLLGIHKAGGAYVPLDPVYPRERLAMMLEDSKATVLLTQRSLADKLPLHGARVMFVDELAARPSVGSDNPAAGAQPDDLAYVIFTSGSTGRPKGVMVRHRNVSNFFSGMDSAIGKEPGVWLAVTSISFDISVLELFWTLTRGFEVVIQEESDRASLANQRTHGERQVTASAQPMDFGLFYFAADSGSAEGGNAYRLLLDGARFADTHDFSTVWTPERHFHAFGGLYPNPAVTTAALSTITSRVALRAGSVVLPLHNPLRVAEDWSVIDQLSGGRVGLSFASGWHVNDFAFMPENYAQRRDVMLESIDTVLKLWSGESVSVKNGLGETIQVRVLPRPVQARPPIWIASAGSIDTFKLAGKLGVNVLTNMLGQDLADLKTKLSAYRAARQEHGHSGPGQVTVMLHTFVCADTEEARRLARKPFCNYLASSFDLVKVAPWMFPAFRQPSKGAASDPSFDPGAFTSEDMEALLEHAFDRYFDTAGLFGTPERALTMVEQLKGIGVDELACLIDFGIDPEIVLSSLPHLNRLRQISNPGAVSESPVDTRGYGIAEQLRDRRVTHLQCTPSMARMLVSDSAALDSLRGLERLMLGGEALPSDLVEQLLPALGGPILNMYGPTETTIWSTTSRVRSTDSITIGRPIANTVIRILDAHRQLVPVGTPGELCIGGAGVVRGYLGRPDLTAERFVADPCADGQIVYRTGDLARYRADGEIEFLGRLDHQVKVNGYRIELGEIETVLSRHPAVRQNVVVARSDDGPAQLVGYLITAARESEAGNDKERVSQWQNLWDETYKQGGRDSADFDARFNISGWNDSYTGEPIPAEQMREWLDQTAQSIEALSPKRVLEIGCGTGMVLYRIAPKVDHYIGVDLSPHALETIRRELTPSEASKVTLLQQAAHALEGVADRSCDTVIINSVAQYFPDPEYLVRVLSRASELVSDGGHIFVGDVRSLAHLRAFHTLVELHHAPAHLDAGELAERIACRVAEDNELVLSEAFFHALTRQVPRITGVDVALKRATAHNEMSCFRYDVVLHVGGGAASDSVASDRVVSPWSPDYTGEKSLLEIAALLAREPAQLVLADLPNARLSDLLSVSAQIDGKSSSRAEELRLRIAAGARAGVDPGSLSELNRAYDVSLSWAASGDIARFDAVFRHRERGPSSPVSRPVPQSSAPAASYANRPAKVNDSTLPEQLRTHLREFLPEYMIPAAFVMLDAFPLTPNGKIDRKALPPPERVQRRSADEYLPPSNDLERAIADVWQKMLGLERVGRCDNIFDLGANSLLTVQANGKLSAVLDRKVSLVSMFRFPTVESLAAHLAGDAKAPDAEKRTQERADRKKDAAARRRELREGRSG